VQEYDVVLSETAESDLDEVVGKWDSEYIINIISQ